MSSLKVLCQWNTQDLDMAAPWSHSKFDGIALFQEMFHGVCSTTHERGTINGDWSICLCSTPNSWLQIDFVQHNLHFLAPECPSTIYSCLTDHLLSIIQPVSASQILSWNSLRPHQKWACYSLWITYQSLENTHLFTHFIFHNRITACPFVIIFPHSMGAYTTLEYNHTGWPAICVETQHSACMQSVIFEVKKFLIAETQLLLLITEILANKLQTACWHWKICMNVHFFLTINRILLFIWQVFYFGETKVFDSKIFAVTFWSEEIFFISKTSKTNPPPILGLLISDWICASSRYLFHPRQECFTKTETCFTSTRRLLTKKCVVSYGPSPSSKLWPQFSWPVQLAMRRGCNWTMAQKWKLLKMA